MNSSPCDSLGRWISHAIARNGISTHRAAQLAGLHHNTLKTCIDGESYMHLLNIVALIGVISKCEDRSPAEVMQEAVLSIRDIQLMEQRYNNKKAGAKTAPARENQSNNTDG